MSMKRSSRPCSATEMRAMSASKSGGRESIHRPCDREVRLEIGAPVSREIRIQRRRFGPERGEDGESLRVAHLVELSRAILTLPGSEFLGITYHSRGIYTQGP